MPAPFLRNLKRSNTVVHQQPEQQDTMFVTLAGVILAVLSLPFAVYGGDRTICRIPRPEFVRSLSDRLRNKYREDAESDRASSVRSAPTSPSLPSAAIRPSLRRAMTTSDGISRVETDFSVASNDTYIRGPMTLEKTGLD